MKRLNFLGFVFIVSILFLSCNKKKNVIERGFYYWKTDLSFSPTELKRLSALQVKKFYIKFFDVNTAGNLPVPAGKITIGNVPGPSVEIIPVVFITNKTLTLIEGWQIDSLALNISGLINKTASLYNLDYKEVQLDCDWSLTTKEKYFYLLKQIRHFLPGKKLSCTIRLHQVKYYNKTGIPAVDRGMLMFYNMGNLQDISNNSIFNEKDARKYLAAISGYPIPLDVALPVFGWVKQFRYNKVVELMNHLTEDDLKKDSSFSFTSGHRYAVQKDMFYRGSYLQKGDMLVAEEIKPELAMNAARLLKKYFTDRNCNVVLYHWDSLNLSRYDNKELQDIYTVFE